MMLLEGEETMAILCICSECCESFCGCGCHSKANS